MNNEVLSLIYTFKGVMSFLKVAIVEDLASAPTASYPDGSIARRESWLPLSSSAWKFLGKGSGWPSLGHMGISWAT